MRVFFPRDSEKTKARLDEGYSGWAVMEWECCIKHPEDGAREGAEFIKKHIIRITERAFDDFAQTQSDDTFNRKILGL